MSTAAQKTEFKHLADALYCVRKLPHKTIYRVDDIVKLTDLSVKTVNEKLQLLSKYWLVFSKTKNTFMMYDDVIAQPNTVFQKITPSLISYKHSRWFGRKHDQTDVDFAMKHMPPNSLVTLDYKAAELTSYQYPRQFYVYVDDVEVFASLLKRNGFVEEDKNIKSRVILLPKIGSFENYLERVFLDCVAAGGRDFMDAIAIMALYGHKIKQKTIEFPDWAVDKVLEDLPICR